MRYLLLPCLALLLAAPAYAQSQGNSITVIGEDGKPTTVDLGAPQPQTDEDAPQPLEMRPREAAPPQAAAPVPPVSQETTTPPAAPEPAPAAPEAAPTPAPEKPALVKKTVTKAIKKPPAKKTPPKKKPVMKPVAASQKPGPPPVSYAPVITPGVKITKEQAINLALTVAPPAKRVEAVERTFGEKLVYVVTFKTDTGEPGEDVDVLVDAYTGAVHLAPVR